MTTKYIQPKGLFESKPYGFSHVAVNAGTQFIHVAGQVAWSENQEVVGKGDIKQQTLQALRNIEIALASADASMKDISSMRIYVVQYQPEHGRLISQALKSYFQDDFLPASTWVGISALAHPDFLVEIEVSAVI